MHALTDVPPLAQIDATDPGLLQDPYAYYARLREEAPVFRDPKTGIVAVSRYDLVQQVTRNPALFSSHFAHLLNSGGTGRLDQEEAAIMAAGLPWVDTLLTADAPQHTRYRRIAMKAFTPARVAAMQAYIERTTHDLIDRFIGDGVVEFKTGFADHLPSIVVADALGIERGDVERFHDWLRAGIARLAGNAERGERLASARKEIELQQYFLAAIAARRAQRRDDIISDLVYASLDDEHGGRPLNDAELYAILQQIFNAGQETTAHTLTYAIYQLLQHPQQLAEVQADPALAANMVEESLRHLSPTNNMWRVVAADTELGGVALKAGETMLLRFGAANRDGERFADAERYDIHRDNAGRHLAFGHGAHVCLGAALARKEMVVALPIVLQRLRNLRFAEGLNSFRFSPSPLLRGVLSLHLRFDRG
ncbi:cytochrome P450 [Hydrocarboniphaga sp.]|uniref:cytochrome P450 n=1 Tax=Hydrocarboniphaga sp. TaxID=2033016 RepID=UPI003D13F0CF